MLKIIQKERNKGVFSRGTHVDATWHARPRGSATQAHAAPTRRECDVYIIYILLLRVIVRINIPYSELANPS